ncbi:hypothetical protein [Streptomyces nigra]
MVEPAPVVRHSEIGAISVWDDRERPGRPLRFAVLHEPGEARSY